MPMMTIEPLVLQAADSAIGTPEALGLAAVSGLVCIGAFRLCTEVIKGAREERALDREERAADRRVRENQIETYTTVVRALNEALNALREVKR